jgi:hypothetical protein
MTRSHDTLIYRVCDCLRRPELLVLYHYTDVIGGFWESLLALLKPRRDAACRVCGTHCASTLLVFALFAVSGFYPGLGFECLSGFARRFRMTAERCGLRVASKG